MTESVERPKRPRKASVAGNPADGWAWLVGGGELGGLFRAGDWSETDLGPVEEWPQSLRSAVSICLGSRFPIVLYWGPRLTVLYNDAYAEILGDKHPWALGRPCQEVWSEIWDVIAPMLDGVVATGQATWSEDQLLILERGGFPEECYFSFSFSPVSGDAGGVDGVFTAVIENTRRVLGERRLRTLRGLTERISAAKDEPQAWRAAAAALAENPADLPFAAFYRADEGGRFVLAAAYGIAQSAAAFEPPFSAPNGAEVLSISRGGATPYGYMAAGISPRRPLDDDYRSFLTLVADHIATGIANVRAYEEERERGDALAEIDRAKTLFFSNVSHEFRTPLTLMLGPVEEALNDASESALRPVQRERLILAQKNALRLLKLVNTLLDFSRIEAGRVRAIYEPVDLAALTTDLASNFRSACEKAGIDLQVDCTPIAQQVYVDRDMWEKIVLNLLSNAFKFTFEGSIRVELGPREDGDGIDLIVRDTGVGVPEAEIPRLFERFHRIEDQHRRSFEGSGIGLALVQELVKLHGGAIAASSQEGQGTTFTVNIPFGGTHLQSDRVSTGRRLAATPTRAATFVTEALSWLGDADRNRAETIASEIATTEAFVAEKGTIFVADDNGDMRDYLRGLLGRHWSVELFVDGEAALEAMGVRRPDLVLADVMMPRLDGFGLLAAIRADPGLADLPVIMLSARTGEEARLEGAAAGADDYLIKPFSARELLARVNTHLSLARIRREAILALRESEARFRTLSDSAPALIWVNGVDGCEYVNREYLDFLGARIDDVRGYDWSQFIHPDDRSAYVDAYIETLAKREIFAADFRFRRHDGEYRWMKTVGQPRFSSGGDFTGYAGVTIDMTEHKQAQEALRESEERFRNMADHAPVMLWVTDSTAHCTYLNRGWYQFTGQTPQTGLGYGWLNATHPEDKDEAERIFLAANEARESFRLEYRLRRRDGVYRWVIDAARPRFDDNGQFLGYIGSVIDISERREAEETQRLLVRELDHRVKNTLAGVQAIAQQTLRRSGDPEHFVRSFSGRIQSLSRVHAILSETTWQGADLRELIRDQLLLGTVDKTRLTASGPPVQLPAQLALHMALTLHELGTNAIKYGALSGPRGEVKVSWEMDGKILRLRWEELGGPPVQAPTTRGFGLTLIEQTARSEGGEARMSIGIDGIAWDIELPLPTPSSHAQRLPDIARLPDEQGNATAPQPERMTSSLSGACVLVIEDEALVALDMIATLESAGATVLEPVGNVAGALRAIEDRRFDLALLDGNLRGEHVDQVAAALVRQKKPFAFVSGYGSGSLPKGFGVSVLAKPFSPQALVDVVAALLTKPSGVVRLRE